jgi:hypothetical protein
MPQNRSNLSSKREKNAFNHIDQLKNDLISKINDCSNKQNIVKTIHFTSPIKKSVFFPAIRPLSDFFLTARKEANPFYKKPNQSYLKP